MTRDEMHAAIMDLCVKVRVDQLAVGLRAALTVAELHAALDALAVARRTYQAELDRRHVADSPDDTYVDPVNVSSLN